MGSGIELTVPGNFSTYFVLLKVSSGVCIVKVKVRNVHRIHMIMAV